MKIHLAVAAAVIFLSPVTAEAFPDKPLKWVIPFAPGSSSDMLSRMIGKVLAEKLGQPILIENKTGAGGIVAAEAVATSKPDGYTMFYATSGPMAVNPALHKSISYGPANFRGIHGIAISPVVFSALPSRPYKDAKELIEHAKKTKAELNYTSVGVGTTYHLAGEMLGYYGGIKMTHIPYRGSAQAITDVLAGTVDISIDAAYPIKPFSDSGQLRTLAVAHTQRLPILPHVPTTVELGYPDVIMAAWSSAAVAAGTPDAIVDRLAQAFSDALKDPGIVKYYADSGSIMLTDLKTKALDEFYATEVTRFKKLIEATGVKAE